MLLIKNNFEVCDGFKKAILVFADNECIEQPVHLHRLFIAFVAVDMKATSQRNEGVVASTGYI